MRALEHASLELEREDFDDAEATRWLRMLLAPGSSLGGARPKASVVDERGRLWIAKFPSRADTHDVGAWERVLHELARRAAIEVPEAIATQLGAKHHAFLSRRFDRIESGQRLHQASALTLLERVDGDDASTGASYLELADVIVQRGAEVRRDLVQLWRRIVFFCCVSNCDDHRRNHAFLLEARGWTLAPAYDMNPDPDGDGLSLNIDEHSNSQELELARSVAPSFRVHSREAEAIIALTRRIVSDWRLVAQESGIGSAERDRMERAFSVAERD